MHDTAFHIGTLAMRIYTDLGNDSILEIGSQEVNGSLRESALPGTRYVGVDIEEGAGVDLVAEPGKPLPVEDNSFDLVIATSVFEHDPFFWITFLDMCRAAKEGGYVYINAPSNGLIHRYPEDNWRFYPDSGKALAMWALSQGTPVVLVESFIAKREKDIWNDFVAVFRKGKNTKTLPQDSLHEHVSCTEVITWKSKEIINPSPQPEDLVLLNEALERALSTEAELRRMTAEWESFYANAEELKVRLKEAEEERQRQIAELNRVQNDLTSRNSELRQSQEEIKRTRSELKQARSRQADLSAELSANGQRLALEIQQKQQLETELNATKQLYEEGCAQAAELKEALEQARAENSAMRARLNNNSKEIAALTEKLQQRETDAVKAAEALGRKEAELSTVLNQTTEQLHEIERLQLEANRLQSESAAAEERLSATYSNLERQVAALRRTEVDLHNAEATIRSAEEKLNERFQEVAALTDLLLDQEQQNRRSVEQIDWILAVHQLTCSNPRWWNVLPRQWRRRREYARLQRSGLFDGDAYLSLYPDVAEGGMDPLQHYLFHGIHEGRFRPA